MKLLSKPTRQRLEAVAARAALWLFRALPVDAASAVGGWLARTIGPRLGVSRVARRNLARALPDKNAAEIEAIVTQVWDNLGRVVGEIPHVGTLIRERVEVIGLEHVAHMRDDGKPGLFVGAHFGNWELAGALALRENLDLSVVYRAANNPWVEDVYRECRANAGSRQVRKGPEGAREILTILRQGGHVGMLIDQKMNDGIAVPFFGRDAMTAPAAARFALKFRCPVSMLRVERLRGARFRMTFMPPLDLPDSGDIHADTLTLTTRMTAQIEDWVRQDPGQWLWLHKRWPD
ncbi:MAG: lysophospholipid acyltransferase family protein [Bacteroidales bacterium]